MIAGRTPSRAQALADRWGTRSGSFREAAEFGDVALLAVLYQGMPATLAAIGNSLAGKVIIDCTNPVETSHFTLTTTPGRSMAQEIQEATGGQVVKAFNLCEAGVWRMEPPLFDGRRLTVPYCTDHPDAAAPVRQLIAGIGAEPLSIGSLQQAHHLEAMAAVLISLLFGGRHPRTVFNLVDAPG